MNYDKIQQARGAISAGLYDDPTVISSTVDRIVTAHEVRVHGRKILAMARAESDHVFDPNMAADIRQYVIRRELRKLRPEISRRLRWLESGRV